MSRTIKSTLAEAREQLAATSVSPSIDAEVLLSFVLHKNRSYLHAWPEKNLSEIEVKQFEQLLKKRAEGEPIAYLTGQREFWSLMLNVSAETLIPRPETERLVELALEKIPLNTPTRVADLGTGSGAIALAIAKERPQCKVTATDLSQEALLVAQDNASRLDISNVIFRKSNWCESLGNKTWHIIVSNPPYIETSDAHLSTGDVRFEPRQALESGAEGLDAIRQIAQDAHAHLEPGGWLMLEHGYTQREEVLKLLQQMNYINLEAFTDLAGTPRVCIGRTKK